MLTRLFALFPLIFFLFSAPVRADEGLQILAFGDSLTHGYGLGAGQTFPDQLEKALKERGWNVSVINGGNSGDTSASGLARLDWALLDQPDVVIVELGANDGLRGLEPSQTRQNLEAIVEGFKDSGARVLLTGMRAPRNLGSDYVADFDRLYPELAKQLDVAFYPFFLEGVALEPALNQQDGIHPNEKGVAKIVDGILPYLLPLLQPEGGAG